MRTQRGQSMFIISISAETLRSYSEIWDWFDYNPAALPTVGCCGTKSRSQEKDATIEPVKAPLDHEWATQLSKELRNTSSGETGHRRFCITPHGLLYFASATFPIAMTDYFCLLSAAASRNHTNVQRSAASRRGPPSSEWRCVSIVVGRYRNHTCHPPGVLWKWWTSFQLDLSSGSSGWRQENQFLAFTVAPSINWVSGVMYGGKQQPSWHSSFAVFQMRSWGEKPAGSEMWITSAGFASSVVYRWEAVFHNLDGLWHSLKSCKLSPREESSIELDLQVQLFVDGRLYFISWMVCDTL